MFFDVSGEPIPSACPRRRDPLGRLEGLIGVEPHPTETAVASDIDPSRPFSFDIAKIPGQTNLELMGEAPEAQALLDLLGRDLVTRTIIQTPELTVDRETAAPEEAVKPHRTAPIRRILSLRASCYSDQKGSAQELATSRRTSSTPGVREKKTRKFPCGALKELL